MRESEGNIQYPWCIIRKTIGNNVNFKFYRHVFFTSHLLAGVSQFFQIDEKITYNQTTWRCKWLNSSWFVFDIANSNVCAYILYLHVYPGSKGWVKVAKTLRVNYITYIVFQESDHVSYYSSRKVQIHCIIKCW